MTNRIKVQTSNDVNFGVINVSAATKPGYVYQERQLRRKVEKISLKKNYVNNRDSNLKERIIPIYSLLGMKRFPRGKESSFLPPSASSIKSHQESAWEHRVTNPGWFEFRGEYYEVLSSFAFGVDLKNLV
ncbi:MAG: hypothetical protein PUP91_06935 [Rhizonema sp. PD37]|nr:hypothetical protein [Rhizonema sp. PD37]